MRNKIYFKQVAGIFIVLFILITIDLQAQGTKFEAEDAEMVGTTFAKSHTGFSGTGYVTGFDNDGDKVIFNITIENEGNYQLYIGFSSPNGNKNNTVYINGTNQGSILFASSSSFKELNVGKIWLNKGTNIITVQKDWGWFELDYIRLDSPEAAVSWNISKNPVNQNATQEAKALYAFLIESFGKTTFAGQFMNEDISYTAPNSEFSYILNKSGKYPTVYGADLIDYSPSRTARGVNSIATEDVIKWSKNEGGIVTLMWHWNAPTDLIDAGDWLWWRGFYTEATTFDISTVINDPESERYNLLLRDIDAIAVELKKIQAEKIPVLWRPLHEAEGAWFWWGAKGADACKKLWILLYDRLTNYHGINNLIWVWTTTDSNKALDWYPGDKYVDILGVDVYLANGDYGTSSFMFDNLRRLFNGTKLLAMSENGPIPDPAKMYDQGAHWSYFCTWVGNHISDGKANTVEHINEVFNHKNITTIDEFPQLWKAFNYVKTIRGNNSDIQIYPIPIKNLLKINFSGNDIPLKLTIMNSNGKTMESFARQTISKNNTLYFDEFPSGLYLICIETDNGLQSYKVMKN